jgi:hypothetical protein
MSQTTNTTHTTTAQCAICARFRSPVSNTLGYCTRHLYLRCHAARMGQIHRILREGKESLAEDQADRAKNPDAPPRTYVPVLANTIALLGEMTIDSERECEELFKANDTPSMESCLKKWQRSSDEDMRHLLDVGGPQGS